MRSYTFSFKTRVAAFIAVLFATVAGSEVYCRWSSQFSDFSFYYIKFLMTVDASQSILGDSHVGLAQRMPPYAFLGQPGQQPKELLLLVHYLYDRAVPRRVILEASPQWFGYYHWNRKPLLTARAFPPDIFGFHPLILSEVYSSALFDNLVSDGIAAAAAMIPKAHAEVPKPSIEEVSRVADQWQVAAAALGTRFNWADFPDDNRGILTASRVYDQNPVEDFETSQPAADYEAAIKFLLQRGAEVCLFRTPVTADYLATEKLIADSRFDEFDRYANSLARSLSIRLIDFRQLDYQFDDSKFFNQDHMNDKTAAEVWPLVARSCFGAESNVIKRGQSMIGRQGQLRSRALALAPNIGIWFTASTTAKVITSMAMPSTAIAARSPLSLRS